jgi:hypothetical protein
MVLYKIFAIIAFACPLFNAVSALNLREHRQILASLVDCRNPRISGPFGGLMPASVRKLLLLMSIVAPLSGQAQDQCPTNPTADYELTAATGTPVPLTSNFDYTRKNDTSVLVRLKDINPYAFKCTVASTSAPFKEPDISSFTSLIGGVAGNLGATVPAPSSPTPTSTPAGSHIGVLAEHAGGGSCFANYSPTHQQVVRLHDVANLINSALQATQNSQNDKLSSLQIALRSLRHQASCQQTVMQADAVLNVQPFDIAQVAMPASTLAATPSSVPLTKAIDWAEAEAQRLSQHLLDGLNDDCRTANRTNTEQDMALINALISVGSSTPSAVSTWRSQLKALNTVRNNMISVRTSVNDTLANRANFTQDLSIGGNQQVVTYTAKCTAVPELTIPSPDPDGLAAPTPSPTPAPTPTPNTWSQDFKFGVGPRLVIAGGVVISPLQQVTFSTTATPGGSGATANTIIQQQNSSTRILPIAMLHGRFWDQLYRPGSIHTSLQTFSRIFPTYLSAGVTAKSTDNNGTSIEYLFGPSWALVNRQIFITAGAYAGHQQRLVNPLTVGSTTALGSANLPITQTTIWKAGFALTWAPGGK